MDSRMLRKREQRHRRRSPDAEVNPRADPLTAAVTLTIEKENNSKTLDPIEPTGIAVDPTTTPAGGALATTAEPSSPSTTATPPAAVVASNTPAAPSSSSLAGTPFSTTNDSTGGSPDPHSLFKSIPGGTISAIVIAIVLVVTIICVYIYRKNSLKARRRKTRNLEGAIFNQPHAAGGTGGYPQMATASQRSPLPIAAQFTPGPRASSEYSNVQAYALRNAMAPPSPLSAPPAAYGNPMNYPMPGNQRASTGLQVALGTAVGIGMTMGTASPLRTPGPLEPVRTATVVCTFIPTLPDELSITPGEQVQVLADYDDGWAFCVNLRGEQGMIPLECIGKGVDVQSVETMSVRRASSLTSTTLGTLRR